MKRSAILIFFLLLFGSTAFTFSGEKADKKAAVTITSEPDDITCITKDNNGDGKIDYLLRVNEAGEKVYEELDFNYDGKMDDFYFYQAGVLVRREIDSNYDGKTDIWVYIYKGVYVKGYERDLDFDGEPDIEKSFDLSEQ